MTNILFNTTPEGRESSKYLMVKVHLLLEELHKEGKVERSEPDGELGLVLEMVENDTKREFTVCVSTKNDDEVIKTDFSSNNLESEEEMLQRTRDVIQYMVRELSSEGLDRVNARYGVLSEQDEPQGQC